MQATIKMDISELDYAFFKKLKALFKGGKVELNVYEQESNEEYLSDLEKAIDDVENKKNLIHFTGEEYENLIAKLS